MSDTEDGMRGIEVDADSYATAAVEDTPAVSRTHQTEEAFQAIKATYQAKQHNGNLFAELIGDIPILDVDASARPRASAHGKKVKLDKRQQALFGYAVGELYYDREFEKILKLCERASEVCAMEGKFEAAVERWQSKAAAKLAS